MTRQSISLTEPNTEWLRQKVDVEGEYRSNSELVNDLIRQARAREEMAIGGIRAALALGEASGPDTRSVDDLWQQARQPRPPKDG